MKVWLFNSKTTKNRTHFYENYLSISGIIKKSAFLDPRIINNVNSS